MLCCCLPREGSAAGLSFKGSYTYAKALTMNGGRRADGNIAQVQDSANLRAEKGSAADDLRQRFVYNWVYELPWGKGKALGGNMSPIADKILGGWSVSGITTFRTGLLSGRAGRLRQQLQLRRRYGICRAGSEFGIRTWTATVWTPQCSTSMPSTGLGRQRLLRQIRVTERQAVNILEGNGINTWDMAVLKNVAWGDDTGSSSAGSCSMPSIMPASANLVPTGRQSYLRPCDWHCGRSKGDAVWLEVLLVGRRCSAESRTLRSVAGLVGAHLGVRPSRVEANPSVGITRGRTHRSAPTIESPPSDYDICIFIGDGSDAPSPPISSPNERCFASGGCTKPRCPSPEFQVSHRKSKTSSFINTTSSTAPFLR